MTTLDDALDRPSGMLRRRMRAVSRFAPPLALMGLMFYLSAQPDLGTGLGTIDTVLRKIAHLAEYGLLWLLWHRALGWRAPLAAAVITVLYGISDELHQTTVETREGSPVDVLIDAAGVALAWFLHDRYGERLHDRLRGRLRR